MCPQLLEPEKCEEWEWMSWKDLVNLVERQSEATDDEAEVRYLFMPLETLVRQRPGIVPIITL